MFDHLLQAKLETTGNDMIFLHSIVLTSNNKLDFSCSYHVAKSEISTPLSHI